MTRSRLQLKELACTREGRLLFSSVSLSVGEGECVELTGPNGSGKSTLLRCIAGLYPDYEGDIERSSRVEYLGHKSGISGLLTPLQNLTWYQELAGRQSDLSAVLARVGLPGYEHVQCQRLSAGQQRRVALARLLIGGADLWLLDEPFTALDGAGQQLVREVLQAHLQKGGSTVCATHQSLGISPVTPLRLGAIA